MAGGLNGASTRLLRLWHCRLVPLGKIVNDRAMRTIIALAVFGKMAKRAGHIPKFSHLTLQFGDVRQRDLLNIGTRARPVAPQCKQAGHLLDREAKIAGTPDEPERMHIAI